MAIQKRQTRPQTALLEVWAEELPASYIGPALRQLETLVRQLCAERSLSCGKVTVYGTPNRLAVIMEAVAPETAREMKEYFGPPERMLRDAAGAFTSQALGFARKYNVPAEKIEIAGGRGVIRAAAGGVPAETVLAELFPAVIAHLEFPKTMVWETARFRFARPIRGIAALYGDSRIRFTVAGVSTSAATVGLHAYARAALKIPSAEKYLTVVRNACVIIDPAERKTAIRRLAEQALRPLKARLVADESLIEEVAFLVEHPAAVVGAFRKEYLEVPSEALMTCLKDKQRFFAAEDADGRLLPYFVGIRNGRSEHQETVREGYERVVEARLSDVRFFYEKDRKTTLLAKVEKLHALVQTAELGSMFQKSGRLIELTGTLAEALSLAEQTAADAKRAALLSKADLVTDMVFEYPELQGVMGGIYARRDGESEAVARAVREQYLPVQGGGALPATDAGRLLALADKIDSLCSSFALGYQPKGSGDPFGLRRMALGVISILLENGFSLDLDGIVGRGFALLPDELTRVRPEAPEALMGFIKQRLFIYFTDTGAANDAADAVLSGPLWRKSIPDARRLIETLAAARAGVDFEPFILLYRRAANILKQAAEKKIFISGECEPGRLIQPEEKALWERCAAFEAPYRAMLAGREYRELIAGLVAFRETLNTFFAVVLVMADEEVLKKNRLALLDKFLSFFRPLADFSKIVIQGEGEKKS